MRRRGFARMALPAVALLLLVGAVFHAAPQAHFLNFDDGDYVTGNPVVRAGLSPAGVRWAFTTFHAANWHPLTWLSHMLDCTLFGLDPGKHHLVSLLLHAANTVLWFLLWNALTGRRGPSLALAAFWGVHPLHVESALWIAERKDLLSTFFGLLSLLSYRAYLSRRRGGWYGVLLGTYTLSLLSKPMLVTLPFVLLLLDYWPLGRLRRDGSPTAPRLRGLWEKVPLLTAAVASGFVTLAAQRAGGTIKSLAVYPLGFRIENALESYVAYLSRTFAPAGLSVFYPHAGDGLHAGRAVAAGALVLALCVVAWAFRRSYPFLLTGWVWYLITLLPVIGILRIGNQASADRYTYLPLTGVFLLVVWGADAVLSGTRWGAAALTATSVTSIVLFGATAERRIADWRDSTRLFGSALAVNAENSVAHEHLGLALVTDGGDLAQGVAHLQASVRLRPTNPMAHNSLGVALARLGRGVEATAAYQQAVRLKPDYAEAWFNLGLARLGSGDLAGAAAIVQTLERLDREYAARLATFVGAVARSKRAGEPPR